ncbi:MAG: PDZ domain-containing protein, partial [Rikenellaceae bacterium]|nr:PDZ domain-containing protein [Rikenellaceae bacterium]
MKKYILLMLMLLSVAAPTNAQLFRNQQQPAEAQEELQKFDRFFQLLTTNFFDSIPYPQLIETAIRSVLAELDPHSVYLTAREMQGQNEQFQGNFSGIGVEFNVLNDTLIIVNTVSGGPSEKVGVMPNDRIVAIDGENVVGILREDVPSRLRGPRGTAVV